MTQEIIRQQIDYYRARAGEYDEWFYRLGRYDRGEEINTRWFDEAASIMRELENLGQFESVLELACGTGIWTRELVKIGRNITALDASPEVIAINREKLGDAPVEYVLQDLFAWEPDRQYDLVFFSFWLSHVPPELLDTFLSKVYRATKPGGQIFLVDSRFEPTSPAVDNPLREDEHILRTRKLNDGRKFKIVKVFYRPEELKEKLEQTGFEAQVMETPAYFIYASAKKQ